MIFPDTPPPLDGRYIYSGVQVLRVVDGDTVQLRLPLPFGVKIDQTVRLAGVNTPEMVGVQRAAGLGAKAFVEGWLMAGPLTVQTFRDRQEKYGRLLALVWVEVDGRAVCLNAELIRTGHGQPYDGGRKPDSLSTGETP